MRYLSTMKLGDGGNWYPVFNLDNALPEAPAPVFGSAGYSGVSGPSEKGGGPMMPFDYGQHGTPGMSAIALVSPIATGILWNASDLSFNQNSDGTSSSNFWQSGQFGGNFSSFASYSSADLHASGWMGTLDAFKGHDASGFSSFYYGFGDSGDYGQGKSFDWTVEIMTKHTPAGDVHFVAVDTKADSFDFSDVNNQWQSSGNVHEVIDTTHYLSIDGPMGNLTLTGSGHETVDTNHFGGQDYWSSSTTDTATNTVHLEAHGDVAALLGEAGLPIDMGLGLTGWGFVSVPMPVDHLMMLG